MNKEKLMRWIDIMVVPVAIGIVGAAVALGTSLAQLESAEKIADAQIEASNDQQDRQNDFQVTAAVIELLRKDVACTASLPSARSFIGFATPDRSLQLVKLVKDQCGKLPGAEKSVKAAQLNQVDRSLRALTGEGRRVARKALGEFFARNPELVSKELVDALRANPSYRVQLGILVALNHANYCPGQFKDLDDEIRKIPDSDNTIRFNLKEFERCT